MDLVLPSRLREGPGVGLRKGGLDVRYDAFEIRHHIGIGKAQDSIALGEAVIFPLCVICRAVIVASSVDFDEELQFATQKVSEIRSDGHLAAELVAEFSAAQLPPQKSFGGRGGIAEGFCAGSCARFERLGWPTP